MCIISRQAIKALHYPALIGASIILTIGSCFVSAIRPLTQLEQSLISGIGLALGLWGSAVLGAQSAKTAAKDIMRPHARSAFRRVLGLYGSLGRLANTIAESQETNTASSRAEYTHVLNKLQAIVTEQIKLADDALEDWDDIVPEEVEAIRNKVHKKLSEGGK